MQNQKYFFQVDENKTGKGTKTGAKINFYRFSGDLSVFGGFIKTLLNRIYSTRCFFY